MVARPGAISLPLVGGQNQKVDERILAPQEFTSVTNARQTRDGRQQPRDGFNVYPVTTVAGQAASGGVNPVRCVGDGDMFVADGGDLPFWTQPYRAGVRSRAKSGSQDTSYATAKMPSINGGGISSLIPERVFPVSSYRGDREQTSSVADHSYQGEWIVTANLDSGAVNVVWRSRDSLEVVATQRIEPDDYGDPTDPTNYVNCSVVCSTTGLATVVVAVRLDGDVDVIHFADAGDEPTVTSGIVTAMMNTNENSNIDTVTIANSANFALIYCNGASSIVTARSFTPPHASVWSTTVFTPSTQYQMHSLDYSNLGSVLWAVTSTNPAGSVRTVQMGTLNWTTGAATATSAALTIGSPGTVPGIPFCTHQGRLGTSAPGHALALTSVDTNAPTARVYIWSGLNAFAILPLDVPYPGAVIAGRVFLNESDPAYYADSVFRRLLVPMMQAGYSALDTDLAYDDLRPVFLMNLGANPVFGGESGYDLTYRTGLCSEHGLLAINGEVGQATNPIVSPLYPAKTGWTLGAPSKLVRLFSNSGDVDTDLVGAYVLTFDVAIPGRSRRFSGDQWREPLVNLPRQGRLALFKPMKAQQCELEPVRANETVIPGLTPTVCDGVTAHSCGFLEAPVITALTPVVSTVHPPGAGTYSITAVYEWTDSQGRRYQSPPAVPREVTLTASEQCTIDFKAPVAAYSGVSVAVYRTPASGSEFKRDGSITLGEASALDTFIQLTDDQLKAQETLYTSLGEVPNDPPPSAQRFARTRDRVWAYGLDRREVVQASKLLSDGRGIVWSNAPNYFQVLPEDVVAVETLDETAVVFTERAVYTIGGPGPGDDGIGTFTEPGRIPGYVGCTSPRSVISADAGIFFLSQRGIELLPRGFGAAQWVGQPVMDDLATYSVCRGVTADAENDLIIWSMVNPDTWEERLLVYDVRTQTWGKWSVPQMFGDLVDGSNTPTVGLTLGGENPVRTAAREKRLILWTDTSPRVRIQEPGRAKDYYTDSSNIVQEEPVTATWESGWFRFGGVTGWQIVRRMTILCSPLGDDWTLRAELSYNDSPAIEATADWVWTDVQSYSVTESITLELALPIVQFESLKVRLSIITSGENGTPLQVHSVMIHPEADGARLSPENRR